MELHTGRAATKHRLGIALVIPEPLVVEAVGRAGYDWVFIDLQHARPEFPGAGVVVQQEEGRAHDLERGDVVRVQVQDVLALLDRHVVLAFEDPLAGVEDLDQLRVEVEAV